VARVRDKSARKYRFALHLTDYRYVVESIA
jgi:hypothetical protein